MSWRLNNQFELTNERRRVLGQPMDNPWTQVWEGMCAGMCLKDVQRFKLQKRKMQGSIQKISFYEIYVPKCRSENCYDHVTKIILREIKISLPC